MSKQLLLATFEHADDLLAATTVAREKGLRIVDAFTPYAVHGLDRAMGLRPSRLTWVCFTFAMIGVCGMLCFEHLVASVWWPIDIGGKPWNSLPSDVPVAFEAAVFLGAFSSVFALLIVGRLYPGKKSRKVPARVTDDQFILVIEKTDAAFDTEAVEKMLLCHHAVDVEQCIEKNGEFQL